jgi:bifunctional enzyme CysN/CysC/sulfate adenylyltransferase subunit 1
MENNREVLKIVVVGHVDHGKSTVIGRLLYDTKSVPEGKIERVKKTCKEKGKPFEYAYLLDAFEEEQKQGITIDTTQLQFFTDKRDYVIIDAPGHKEFLKNMISGAANAEAALLLVDAHEGVQEQSKRHGYILSLLGIQKVYVLVNKMDLIDYSEEKFNAIRQEMNEFLNSLRVYPMKYIPISAFHGENMTEKSTKMPWYNGDPVLTAMDRIEKDKGVEDKPLRFPIQDVYKFDDRRIIAGRIESGSLKLGDKILISPSNKVTRVKSIEAWQAKDHTDAVYAGMSVGITVEDEFFNKRGEFITHQEQVPLVSEVFRANLFWMGKSPLLKGKKYKLKLATQEVEAEIITVNKVIDASTLEAIENANQVNTNDVADVTIKTKELISFDEFKDNQSTGRFVLVDGYDVSGGGIVSRLEKGIRTSSVLVHKGSEMSVSCFDEYYFVLSEDSVKKIAGKTGVFNAGDVLPLSGNTYAFPENLDILNLEAGTVALVRKSVLQEIISFGEYRYSSVPLIENRGSFLKINSEQNFENFRKEYEAFDFKAEFANRWSDFLKYREIKFRDAASLYAPEFEI